MSLKERISLRSVPTNFPAQSAAQFVTPLINLYIKLVSKIFLKENIFLEKDPSSSFSESGLIVSMCMKQSSITTIQLFQSFFGNHFFHRRFSLIFQRHPLFHILPQKLMYYVKQFRFNHFFMAILSLRMVTSPPIMIDFLCPSLLRVLRAPSSAFHPKSTVFSPLIFMTLLS